MAVYINKRPGRGIRLYVWFVERNDFGPERQYLDGWEAVMIHARSLYQARQRITKSIEEDRATFGMPTLRAALLYTVNNHWPMDADPVTRDIPDFWTAARQHDEQP